MTRPVVRRPLYPSDFRRLFRVLSRWAVASSFGAVSACSAYTVNDDLGPGVPVDPVVVTGGAGGSSGASGAGGTSGTGGVAGSIATGGAGGAPGAGGFGGTGGVSGVGGAGGAPQPPFTDWHPVACSGSALALLEHASLAMPIDYAAIYRPEVSYEDHGDDAGVTEVVTPLLIDAFGSACIGAASRAVCMRSLEELIEDGDQAFLVVSAGDWVSRIEERAALAALIGSVDTEAEAAIVALLEGRPVDCWDPSIGQDADRGHGTRVRQSAEGFYEVRTQWGHCPAQGVTDRVFESAIMLPGEIQELAWEACPIAGRRPAGLAAAPHVTSTEIGAYFAHTARLEAASVHAFETLASELCQLGAPSALIGAALGAALDEVEHARSMGALALRFGAEPLELDIAPVPERERFAIALENAVEGCVRETYAAQLAWYQAEAARDAEVRSAMERIAEDETRHAELAWRVAAFLEPQLSEDEREAIAIARRQAVMQLARELAPPMSAAAAAQVGLPSEEIAGALLVQLDRALGLRT